MLDSAVLAWTHSCCNRGGAMDIWWQKIKRLLLVVGIIVAAMLAIVTIVNRVLTRQPTLALRNNRLTDRSASSRVGGQRVTIAGTFPTSPLRTVLASFNAHGSLVSHH